MGDLTSSRPVRRTTLSGMAGLSGLLAGAMAIFALIVATTDWRNEAAQADWPIVSAVVDRGDVIVSRHAARDGSGLSFRLRYVVRYEADGEERSVTLGSRSASSETEAARLHAFAAQHRRGSHIDGAGKASEAARGGGGFGRQAGQPLAARAGSARRPVRSPRRRGDRRGADRRDPGDSACRGREPDRAAAALIFVFGGVLLALPPGNDRWHRLLGTLLITCFALTFDWVAFGPRERRFGGGFSLGPFGQGWHPGESAGRAVFGAIAVFLDIVAVPAWIDQCRRLLTPNPTSPAPMERDTP